ATYAAAYAVRARPGAPVSAPCTWEEVEAGVQPQSFTLRTMADRAADVGDLWVDLHAHGQALEPAIEALRRARDPAASDPAASHPAASLVRCPTLGAVPGGKEKS